MQKLRVARVLLAALSLASAGQDAAAQAIDRPADERPVLGPFETPAPPPEPLVLPPAPEPKPDRNALARGLAVFVHRIRVEGSTVFSEAELAEVTRPWTDRSIDAGDLQDLVDAVTRLYVDHGYVSSGATVPDQDLDGGELLVDVIEAHLSDVRIEGNRWYRDSYLRSRLRAAIPTPVNVHDVEEQLQLLLQEPDFSAVRGALRPGLERGETVLALVVEERAPFWLAGRVANDNPPAIGSVRGQILGADRSLLGFADALGLRFDFAGGLNAQEARYEFPILPQGTELLARFRRTDAEVVEEPFSAAHIESETWSVGFGLRHPLVQTMRQRLWLQVVAERRQSTTWLAGDRFSFVPGPHDGRANVTVLRFMQEWDWRSPTDVFAARSTLSWGIDALGATQNPGNVPDGSFVAWLGQGQWAHRFPDSLAGATVLARADLQVASNPLLTLEQIAVGGLRTVRGYRENLLVRDNAVIASVEVRVPVLRGLFESDVLELATFYDFGHAWNVSGNFLPAETIQSAGLGVLYDLAGRVQLYAYWGGAFRDVPKTGSNIQDDGFHLGATFVVF